MASLRARRAAQEDEEGARILDGDRSAFDDDEFTDDDDDDDDNRGREPKEAEAGFLRSPTSSAASQNQWKWRGRALLGTLVILMLFAFNYQREVVDVKSWVGSAESLRAPFDAADEIHDNSRADTEGSVGEGLTSPSAGGEGDIRRRCPAGSKISLIYPHVNKAGGRTVEATFGALEELAKGTRLKSVSMAPRSKTHTFSLFTYHRTYPALAKLKGCSPSPGKAAMQCESTGPSECVRWAFTLRDPLSRMLSSFYTMTGRGEPDLRGRRPINKRSPVQGGTGAFGDSHFYCKPGSRAAAEMQRADFTIEEWTRLSDEEREACSFAFNIHTKYLAPIESGGPEAQLATAKERLEQMAWFGILEHWTESLQLFSYVLGTDLVHYATLFNLNKYDKSLSPHARAVLEKHNALDIELYKFAVDLFERRIARMRRDRLDPFFKPYTFTCDKETICWNKFSEEAPWPLDVTPEGLAKHFSSVGEAKELQLCTAKRGCWRDDVEAPFHEHAEQTVPTEQEASEIAANVPAPGSSTAEALESETCLASVLILGARKGGTTSLYTYLSAHPRFYGVKLEGGPTDGELRVLERFKPGRNNPPPARVRQKYNQAFVHELASSFATPGAASASGDADSDAVTAPWLKEILRGEALTGESSVANGPGCLVPRLVAAACGVNPRMRLVYLVRNPVSRIVSNIKMRHRLLPKKYTDSLETSVLDDLHTVQGLMPSEPEWWKRDNIPCLFRLDVQNTVWSSMYIVHLSRWQQIFPKEQLLVLKSEDMFTNPAATLRKTLAFVGLDSSVMDIEAVVSESFNSAPEQSPASVSQIDTPLSDEVTAELQSFFVPFNEALQAEFGIDVSTWN
ncbi:Heparan sulfate glucosamine 3-O-sulfotransferase 3A1 [Hondaea fermentalgiana]|uniref:Heparan sulfate glucosamine 3-O-sulfotransferase 3A1 n=1 Tax=Hondaea fermentalgiana TaxID=2315210 RepID=A0A2R5GKY5_9STRA|nr:Heparan sulfate glucosamine 3-O-sulfotransferase 3A1 [Hondaea fermentalgiana]|eukprot:GBG31547.1 Heparan sulfate glucosamine 3-O-sulfotransferase 3A1 [Hondaea fermentalgiana]